MMNTSKTEDKILPARVKFAAKLTVFVKLFALGLYGEWSELRREGLDVSTELRACGGLRGELPASNSTPQLADRLI